MDFSNKSDEEILEIGEPLWDNMIEGYNEENYEKFSRDFSSSMLKVVNEEFFKKNVYQASLSQGKISTEKTFIGCVRRASGVTILWKGAFTKVNGEVLGQIILDEENDQIKVFHSLIA